MTSENAPSVPASGSRPRSILHVRVGGVPTACLNRAELARQMVEDCMAARNDPDLPAKLVYTSNAHGISLAATDENFRRALAEADLIHADGGVIVAASRLLTPHRIPERSATTDFIHDAAAAAAREGLTFYLLGAPEEINAAAARKLEELYPGIRIVGRRHGYFSEADEEAICAEISASGADVVWIGLGKPKEQIFCLRNRHRIKAGWIATSGGCFHFLSGDYKRAPKWMCDNGLEWLHRMATRPRQLGWRYMVTNPHALYLLATRTGGTVYL
jgi:N-acetylglucosaminyldiphosphoundecaprenol N-acetyl-beta-D-mannosaminyltransferase